VQLKGAWQDRVGRSLDGLEDALVHNLPDAEELLVDLVVGVSKTLLVLVDQLGDSEVVLVAEVEQALRVVEGVCRAARTLRCGLCSVNLVRAGGNLCAASRIAGDCQMARVRGDGLYASLAVSVGLRSVDRFVVHVLSQVGRMLASLVLSTVHGRRINR
jgi:hypothetical protein